MRIASYEGHPDYTPYAIYARVFFNGVEIKYCVFADEERGYIEQYVMDSKGNFTKEGGSLKTCVRYGAVSVDFPARPDLEAQLREERKRGVV